MNWNCPHCGMQQVVTLAARGSGYCTIDVGSFAEAGVVPNFTTLLMVSSFAIACASGECQKVTVRISLGTRGQGSNPSLIDPFFSSQIYPGRTGKPFSNAVPQAFREDYNEAYAIIDLSAKSSATLARRCLQGMIRDFCGIQKRTLFDEIKELEERLERDELPKGVEPETIAAMKALKDIGNIGAHMTVVEGAIVDVDPGEAEAVLELIEMLFADWYVARAKRQERLAHIEAIAASKKPPVA